MLNESRSIWLAGLCLAAALFFDATAAAQSGGPNRGYLGNPGGNIPRLVELADFFKQARDDRDGGFFTFVTRSGEPTDPPYEWWNTTSECGETFDYALKSVAAQSRVAYLFTRAFMVTGRVEYLAYARHALDFLYAHGWDETHDGFWFTTDGRGAVAPWIACDAWDPNDWKWTYAQIYPLVGIGAFVEATRSQFDFDWLRLGLDVLSERLWDATPGRQGYYTDADLDWSNPRGKGFTPVVDGITTHALEAYLLTGTAASKQRLLELADQAVEHLVPSMDDPEVVFGFPEQFDADWQIDRENTSGDIGHVLKTAWVLGRAYLVEPKPAYRDAAQRLIDEVVQHGGYDAVHGGPFTTYDWKSGVIDQTKGYWQIEQGVMAGLINSVIAANAEQRRGSRRMAAESLQFFHEHFWDTEYGGHYLATDAEGNVTDANKSDLFEQGYHVSELLYFSYVYGSLYLKRQPIKLFYHFDAEAAQRLIRLDPIELTGEALRIVSVARDGIPYRRFEPRTRTLRLPAGTSGTFAVVFELDRI